MSEIPLCSVTISSQLPLDEIDSLETSLLINSLKALLWLPMPWITSMLDAI
jgi:hypothetical protein